MGNRSPDRPSISPLWRSYAEAARALGVRLTGAALGPGRSGRRLDDLNRRLQRELDGMTQRAFASLPGEGELACAPGCAHCCRTLPVTVSPIEVFTLVRRLGDLAGAHPSLGSHLAAVRAQAGTALPPLGSLVPCPLLGEDDLCAVYSFRPLACRGCVSGDSSACAARDDNRPVPRSTAHQLGAAALMRGVCEALAGLGLAGRLMELRGALALVLADDGAEKRWLRGDDVFAGLD